jgi:hypothetical protein
MSEGQEGPELPLPGPVRILLEAMRERSEERPSAATGPSARAVTWLRA